MKANPHLEQSMQEEQVREAFEAPGLAEPMGQANRVTRD